MQKRSHSRLAEAVRALSCGHGQKPMDTIALGVVATLSIWGPVAQAQSSDTEEITVTGSRLRRDGMTSPTPVTALDIQEMRVMAPTRSN